MIYPENFESLVGFQRIREIVLAHCFFDDNHRLPQHLTFSTDIQTIETHWTRMDEWNSLRGIVPAVMDFSGCINLLPALQYLGIENFGFQLDDLFAIYNCIEKYLHLKKAIVKNLDLYPQLNALLVAEDGLEKATLIISKVIDAKGNIRPNASVELSKLLSDISKLETRSRSIARTVFNSLKSQGITGETDITVRDGRLVIPLIAEHKKKVQGFLKDVSATGKILYIEPAESVEVNNLLEEKKYLRDAEIERILKAITAELAPYKSNLAMMTDALNDFDSIQSKLYLCDTLKAERPKIVEEQILNLKEAVHPQLWLKNKLAKIKTVPLDITITSEHRLLLISGPNAGGKSIALKTALMLQYMAQCGLFITAAPNSTVGIFNSIAAIIGDGQNVEEGLSTFSAHLQHLKNLLDFSDSKTLFGIDEIGTGTDPHFGAPIAIVLLQNFIQKQSYGIVTSHFSELKNWASQTPNVMNASMLYDVQQLSPLFILKTGKPGSSFALELLKKNNFSENIISDIETIIGEEKGNTEKLMVELQQKEYEINELLDYNAAQRKHLDNLVKEYQELRDKLTVHKSEIVLTAKKEAKNIVDSANTLVEQTVKKIKEKGAVKKVLHTERNKLDNKREQLNFQIEKQVRQNVEIVKAQTIEKIPLAAGLEVKHAINDNIGSILELKEKKSLVLFGIIKMWVENEFLVPINKGIQAKGKDKSRGVGGINWVDKMSSFNTNMDVRGLTGEEAVIKTSKWLSEAYMLGQFNLKIIHGRGTGAVRKALFDYFKTQNFIKGWKYEHAEAGGDGATLVELI